jgi:CheY-like chemotaxis protein
MLFAHEVEILVVDDEPDVLAVTKLALRHSKVFGLPVRVHTAESKAQAIELLNTTLATGIPGFSSAEVAFIDVVMETDHAGLELCNSIRNELGNHYTQLFLRTGQPGAAPEREVIDRYDINGYLSKAEITETKLYTMLKAGARDFLFLTGSAVLGQVIQALIPAARSRKAIGATLDGFVASLQTTGADERHQGFDVQLAFLAGDEMVAGTWKDPADARSRRDELLRAEGRPLGPTGDAVHVNGTDSLIRIAAGEATAALDVVGRGGTAPPDFMVSMWHNFGRCVAELWKLAE